MSIFMKKLKISKIVQTASGNDSKHSDEVYSFIFANYELHIFIMVRGECYAPFPVYVDDRELQVLDTRAVPSVESVWDLVILFGLEIVNKHYILIISFNVL